MKKIVILDFDGTIADTKPVILNTFHRTFDAMHLPQHSDEEIAATIGLPLMEAFPVLEPMDKEKAAECTATYREMFEDAVVVGDTHFDILMGRNAHCMTIGVTYGNGLRESLMEAGADAIVDDFAEIAEIV